MNKKSKEQALAAYEAEEIIKKEMITGKRIIGISDTGPTTLSAAIVNAGKKQVVLPAENTPQPKNVPSVEDIAGNLSEIMSITGEDNVMQLPDMDGFHLYVFNYETGELLKNIIDVLKCGESGDRMFEVHARKYEVAREQFIKRSKFKKRMKWKNKVQKESQRKTESSNSTGETAET